MQWQAVTSSAIGTKHKKIEKPCQDYGAHQILSEGNVLIGAVSDGMGSAKHSEIGSQLAVEVVISELQQDYWQSQLTDEDAVKQFFAQLLKLVKSRLQHKANTQGYPVQDLACTLLAFIATPEWLAAMQVGDGFIVVRAEGGDYELLFQPDKGEFANETTPVTASDALQEMQVCLKLIPYKFICATTDGIENISLVKPENWKPFAKFFRPLEQHMLSRLSLKQKKKQLKDFLHSEKISQSTDDDTTLLLGVYQDSEPKKAEGSPDEKISPPGDEPTPIPSWEGLGVGSALQVRGERAEGIYPDSPSFLESSREQGLQPPSKQSSLVHFPRGTRTSPQNNIKLFSFCALPWQKCLKKTRNQDLKKLGNRITDELHLLGSQKFTLKKIKLNKQGYLEIWLESEQPLYNPDLCYSKISEDNR